MDFAKYYQTELGRSEKAAEQCREVIKSGGEDLDYWKAQLEFWLERADHYRKMQEFCNV